MANYSDLSIKTAFIDAFPEPVLVSDTKGCILVANSAAGSLFACSPDVLLERHLSEFLTPLADAGGGFAAASGTALLTLAGDLMPVQIVATPYPEDDLLVTVIRTPSGMNHETPDRDVSVLDTLSEGVLIVSDAGAITYMNPAAAGMLGLEVDARSGNDVRCVFADSREAELEPSDATHLLDRALQGAGAVTAQRAVLSGESTASLEVSINATPLRSPAGDPSGAVITFQDVSRQRHAELQIGIQKRVLDMIAAGRSLEETGALIVEYLRRVVPGSRGAIYQIERESRRMTQVAAPDLPDVLTCALSETTSDPISAMCVDTLITRKPMICPDVASDELDEELRQLLRGTEIRSLWSYPVSASLHQSVGIICLYRDRPGAPDLETQALIDTAAGLLRVALDRVQIEQELRYQSFNDDLTGLPNRVLLLDRLDLALQRAAQSDNQVALLMLNIDRFQMVNDSLGHHAGDALLQEVARRLRESIRSDDLVARFTGDSFGILLEHISSEADAINVVMRIQRAFATPLNVTGIDIYSSVSIGIALAPDREVDADTLIRYSHIALHRAKEIGRGQFAVFSPLQDLSRVPKIELQSRLHRALAADALDLHFQPVMSLQEDKVAGYEALLRWNDEQFGMVAPDEFLPLAQQSGIMSEITSWVLDRAVSQLLQWHETHGVNLFAAVNISPSEMNDSLLVEQVDAVLRRYRVDPSCLILEMTEHALFDASGQPSKILHRLRKLGIKVALDDFGTGYSSLSYLEQLAVDAIKIDRTFIQAARGGASRAPVATAMVDLARKLGMVSVAEGIETEEDERVARQLGCDLSQGYLYGRPVPGSDIRPTHRSFPYGD